MSMHIAPPERSCIFLAIIPSMRLIQLHGFGRRRVGAIEENDPNQLRPLDRYHSIAALAAAALEAGVPLSRQASGALSTERLDYDAIYAAGSSPWRLLPAIDHPDEPARCMVSGTGLSHM